MDVHVFQSGVYTQSVDVYDMKGRRKPTFSDVYSSGYVKFEHTKYPVDIIIFSMEPLPIPG